MKTDSPAAGRVSASSAVSVAFGSLFAVLLCLVSCAEERQTLGQAYVAPQTLNVRSQISSKSGSVATLKHGEKVSIIDVQRRMVKIVSAAGFEGWVDSYDLLSTEQMRQIQHERDRQRVLPPQGMATAFELLNVHIEPSRRSPAFQQIAEGVPVTMLGRTQTAKNALPTKTSSLIVDRPQPVRRPKREQQLKGGFRSPPRPPAPKPPANWQALSAERIDGVQTPKEIAAEKKKAEAEAAAKKAEEAKHPPVMEDWTLIRTKAGETGWVLTRNLQISIPDEVAQYAEGKRITSYFELGSVNDEQKGLKHHWLWTTLAGNDPVDFDSWRVFLWNARHHRYETSFRKRELAGYFPVEVDPPADGKTIGRTFHIVTKDDDEKYRRRTYSFDGTLVHLIGTEDLQQPGAMVTAIKPSGLDTDKMQSKAHPSWFRRQWSALRSRFGSR
jgi:uncharacterized protein YgiM (DUF1202 family)